MSETSFAERLFAVGFTDLISVIPPGAQLLPSSKISQSLVGKIPGRRHVSGMWAGYNWRVAETTLADVRKWVLDGANIGLRATRFPGVDIDCSDPQLAKMIEEAVLGQLGPAAIRIGKPPKRLLMYSLAADAEPFSRMRLWIMARDGTKHLVEILGEGQQYLVAGTHPSGRLYEWLQDPTVVDEAEITAAQASACLDYIQQLVEMLGVGTVEREGDGKRSTRVPTADQQALLAPSIEALRECVALIPNNDEQFDTRTAYLRVGYAIKAAAGSEHDEDGHELFAEWAARWDGGSNAPDVVRDDWRRMNGERSVGWSFLAQLARPYGYNDAAEEFEVSQQAPDDVSTETEAAPEYSDQDLAERIIVRNRGSLRYVPQLGKWMVWDGARWVVDAELQAEDLILRSLKQMGLEVIRQSGSAKETRDAKETAARICSAGKATAVAQIIRPNRSIAVAMASLDHDPWVLNTPGGIVDLKTGQLGPSDPDALTTKMTAVPPDFSGGCPEWKRFLAEATGGDSALEAYLQRLFGYCLTGITREQHLSFLFGPGGNGKSLLLNQMTGILADYAYNATMETFTASAGDKHSTDLASLHGARLVAASETAAGKKWDDQRIKQFTGGEPVTARFMRQDNFTFRPQAKLVFVGNYQPEIRNVDKAMRRRIQMVPFLVTPKVVDLGLDEKLSAEWPAILAWMIEGCLLWQRDGLKPPAAVLTATDEYFENEDSYGRWIRESLVLDSASATTTQELFRSWLEWAYPRKEHPGTLKGLSAALKARGWEKWQQPGTRRMGFAGIRLNGEDLSLLN